MRSSKPPFCFVYSGATGAALPQPHAHFVSFSKNGGFLHLDAEKLLFCMREKLPSTKVFSSSQNCGGNSKGSQAFLGFARGIVNAEVKKCSKEMQKKSQFP